MSRVINRVISFVIQIQQFQFCSVLFSVIMERKPSWISTLVTQVCLCVALYCALPQKSSYQKTKSIVNRRAADFYFISVTGGFRPLEHQTHLLKQMEHVAKSYQVRFVVNTSELGEDDPLKKNYRKSCITSPRAEIIKVDQATRLVESLKVPWYTTRALKEKEVGCFQEQVQLPHGETLGIIGMDTGSLQEAVLTGLSNATEDNQLNWLIRTLEVTDSHWCIVVGFHPLVVCEGNKEQMKAKKIYESLHHVFMKFGVNLYLSKHGCTKYARQDSVAYIENPDLIESVNEREMVDGFLLHRVSSFEIVTYFVVSTGEVVYRTVTRQRGKEVM